MEGGWEERRIKGGQEEEGGEDGGIIFSNLFLFSHGAYFTKLHTVLTQ